MHHSEQKYARFCSKRCNAGCGIGALGDLRDWSFEIFIQLTHWGRINYAIISPDDVFACWAQFHYLNQCGLIVNWILGKKINEIRMKIQLFSSTNQFENVACETSALKIQFPTHCKSTGGLSFQRVNLTAISVDGSLSSLSSLWNATTWKRFLYCWHFMRGIHWLPVDSLHKGPVMCISYAFFFISMNKLLKKLSSCWQLRRHGTHVTLLYWGSMVALQVDIGLPVCDLYI